MGDLAGILKAGGIPVTDENAAELEDALELARSWLGRKARFRKPRNEVIALLGLTHFQLTGSQKIGLDGPQFRFICGCMKVLQLEMVPPENARKIIQRSFQKIYFVQ